jgi:tRNA A-37 threonylcarbamoyl transferase component Bud32
MIQDTRMLSTAKLVIAPDWQPVLHTHKFDRFDALWNLSGEVVKRSNSTEVLRVVLDGHAVFLKKYWVTNLNQFLSGITRGALFGTSKVQCEFENMQRLRAWGLDAPTPVAWGEQRRAGWLVRSVLVSEGIPDPLPLDRYIVCDQTQGASVVPSSSYKRHRELIDRLADYVRRLHEHKFEHHDLYWRNIILSGDALTHFYLLDAHKGRIWDQKCEREARAHDLATLDAPAPAFFRRTERLRFLLRYLDKRRLDEETKELARLTSVLAEPMRERQLARVREARR